MRAVTEVPEHLLRRSQERKAALAGGESATEATAPATEAAAGSTAVAPAGGATPAATGGGAPARPAEPTYTGPPQPPPRRPRVPLWAMPVVMALPFWAMLYAGAFGERHVAAEGPVAAGAAVYTGQGCGGCHGATGGGGVGPALGNVTATFPVFADHVAWVKNGSASVKGQNYGDGGTGNGGKPATGTMPGFDIPEADIIAVVCHERVTLGGQDPPPPECEEGAEPGADAEGTGDASAENAGDH